MSSSSTVRDVSTSLDMTKGVFDALEIYRDNASRSAAMNMAIDEALLEIVTAPSIRFYRWDHPALSFGYFGKFADVANHAGDRDVVRRWTGGGIVFHGDDLTYSIIIPAGDPRFAQTPMSIYESVHRALCDAIVATGQRAIVAAVADRSADVSDAGYSGHCFANAVRADVLVNGQKVAGAAQRRTRRGLLQQGSIQHVDLAEDFGECFARELSGNTTMQNLSEQTLAHAEEIAVQKYGSERWLRRR